MMWDDDTQDERSLADKLEKFQRGLLNIATGKERPHSETFKRLRHELLAAPELSTHLPDYIRKARDPDQFWEFIQPKFATYQERRQFIRNSMRPALDHLEGNERSPGVEPITQSLKTFDPENVGAAWQKALDRRNADPAGAITAARSLLETVCKHILDDAGAPYNNKADAGALWAQAAAVLNLAPHQHQEEVFRTILGNCQSVVNGLGAIRNKVGDAHGQGRRPVKPKPRHAELAVNLAGTMASFLIHTWKDKTDES
ncbi:abortive infection family protein [Tanticharoenia sakaeratensis]|uniref:Abortive infection protein-like C-terminal domain-containing protein n=1 Tax=Tanticharoenia sakaeratensis NBRC 103193 TaxID=1231623 RepID=A0A0D6MHQ8_9PROT|nr:abortive infection family protein [Tanticharoenia sakaeratensis]GAN53167.1 hypothetical protein Tasa_007_012 [Tanticharoenia sakaeratensis NBRC 103193]GBQ23914.1 abortive phage resistance protein [Tanticharoenia sakaeratensis NBRC 103193]